MAAASTRSRKRRGEVTTRAAEITAHAEFRKRLYDRVVLPGSNDARLSAAAATLTGCLTNPD